KEVDGEPGQEREQREAPQADPAGRVVVGSRRGEPDPDVLGERVALLLVQEGLALDHAERGQPGDPRPGPAAHRRPASGQPAQRPGQPVQSIGCTSLTNEFRALVRAARYARGPSWFCRSGTMTAIWPRRRAGR